MKFQYLGTAAYEGVPAMFCTCDICKRSRKEGGRNIRTRSQAIIDDRILIDFPADAYMHSLNFGIDYTNLKSCIVTHDHSDHFYAEDLGTRTPGNGVVEKDSVFTIYGSAPTVAHATNYLNRIGVTPGNYIDAKTVVPFEPFELEGYTITPLKADHVAQLEPVFYSIEKDGKRVLYAHDTGNFPEETWEYLKSQNKIYDFVSLDCTGALRPFWDINHMCLESCARVKDKLIDMGLCNDKTKFCLNHFSHNGNATYEDMCAAAVSQGFLVSYDGMVVEL